MEFIEAILLTVITASTPLLLAASGELVVERAGVLNLGLEGMMIVGAACGFVGAYTSGSHTLRTRGSAAAAAAISGPIPAGSPAVIATRGRIVLFCNCIPAAAARGDLRGNIAADAGAGDLR